MLGLMLAGPGYRRQGLLVWIGDRPYIDAARLCDRERTPLPRPAWDGPFQPAADAAMPPDSVGARVSGGQAAAERVLRPGETVKTTIPPCRVAVWTMERGSIWIRSRWPFTIVPAN